MVGEEALAGAGVQPAGIRARELATLYQLTDRLYRASSRDETLAAALDAIVSVLGDRASILLFDESGVMRFAAWRGLSKAYRARLEGHSPWTPATVEPEAIFVEDIANTDEPDWVKEAIEAEGIRGLAFIPLVAQRKVIGKFMSYYPDRHSFAEAERVLAVTIARQLGFSLQRARAEEELRESEQRFRLMSEQAPVMIWMSDAEGRCLHLNRLLRRFWGVPGNDIQSFDWMTTMHPEDRGRIGRTMMEATSTRQPVTLEGRYLEAGGTYRVLKTEAQPRFSSSGTFLGMIGVNVDVTKEHETEETLRLLLAELNHRVKNTLAIVQSLAHQTFRPGSSPAEARNAFEGRLVALATAHNLLTETNWENASLERLAGQALRAQGVAEGRVAVSGPPVSLPTRHALAIALALHELGTNALKYGALSNDSGSIELSWTWQPQATLHLAWREKDGPRVSPPQRRGFGSRLIQDSLARDLDASVTFDFRPEGLYFLLEAPLDQSVRGTA